MTGHEDVGHVGMMAGEVSERSRRPILGIFQGLGQTRARSSVGLTASKLVKAVAADEFHAMLVNHGLIRLLGQKDD